jgi:polyisoprenoid-binding protein YceI
MKKIFFFMALVAFVAIAAKQTKVYATKNGTVKFFSSTPSEDIEAINNQVDSKIATNGQVVFQVPIKGFKFDNALMQEHFNSEDYMNSSKYPKGIFMGTVQDMKLDFSKDAVLKVTVKGTLEIHGTKKEISMPGTIEIKNGKLAVKSVFKVKLTDFGIEGHDKVAKEIEVTVDCTYQ